MAEHIVHTMTTADCLIVRLHDMTHNSRRSSLATYWSAHLACSSSGVQRSWARRPMSRLEARARSSQRSSGRLRPSCLNSGSSSWATTLCARPRMVLRRFLAVSERQCSVSQITTAHCVACQHNAMPCSMSKAPCLMPQVYKGFSPP